MPVIFQVWVNIAELINFSLSIKRCTCHMLLFANRGLFTSSVLTTVNVNIGSTDQFTAQLELSAFYMELWISAKHLQQPYTEGVTWS